MYIDLSEFPAGLATLLTTTAEIAGLILCAIIFVATVIPFVFLLRGTSALIPIIALAVIESIALSLIGWLNWWVTIVLILGICGMYALAASKGAG